MGRRPAATRAADAAARADRPRSGLVVGGHEGHDRALRPPPASRPGRTRTSPGPRPPATCGRVAGTTRPACVSTTVARAARSWSASQVAGSNRDRSRRYAVRERMTSGGSSMPRRNSSTSMPVLASRDSQPPSTSTRPAHRSPSSTAAVAATIAPNPWPASTTRDPPPGRGEQPGSLGDRHDVGREDRQVVRAVIGRGVREAVPAQVHRHDPSHAVRASQPPRDRRPDPGRLRQPVDRHDPGAGAPVLGPAPVEEVDPVPRLGHDDEPVRLERRVRLEPCRDGGG